MYLCYVEYMFADTGVICIVIVYMISFYVDLSYPLQ